MQASQQTSISPQPEVTKTDVQSTVLSLQNYILIQNGICNSLIMDINTWHYEQRVHM